MRLGKDHSFLPGLYFLCSDLPSSAQGGQSLRTSRHIPRLLVSAVCDIITSKGSDRMKLNPDCVRDLLIEVEEKADGVNYFCFNSSGGFGSKETPNDLAEKYTRDEVIYHIIQCNESGFFVQMKKTVVGTYKISCLSPKGHQFLNDIRNNTNWERIKKGFISVGGFSFKALIEIAQNIATNYITSQLG